MHHSYSRRYLILDTCIVQYWMDRYIESAVREQLSSWVGTDCDLAISEVSYAELIDGAYREKVDKVKVLLKTFARLEVSQRVLSGSGFLGSIYRNQNSRNSGIELADRIIAATSFINNTAVITANIQDFPLPFFTSVYSENIMFKKKNKKRYITIDILKPNITILNYWYSKTQ